MMPPPLVPVQPQQAPSLFPTLQLRLCLLMKRAMLTAPPARVFRTPSMPQQPTPQLVQVQAFLKLHSTLPEPQRLLKVLSVRFLG